MPSIYYTKRMKIIYFLTLALFFPACSVINYHGNEAISDKLKKLKPQQSTAEKVRAVLGSPSYVSIDGKRLWLYISQEKSARLPTFETETKRRVVGIYFNPKGLMVKGKILTLADGQDLTFIPDTTPSPIPELNWVQRLFSNVGRVTPVGPTQQGP
jgi:outer membrane protein assembly factor BamE (lipoprotein component of BamABCDE complex)